MADFCKQCHIEMFGDACKPDDKYDFAGFSTKKDDEEKRYVIVLCEGCKAEKGYIYVNSEGE